MLNVADLKKVYFLGIGGIGMSAIARYFVSQKVQVYGYDLTQTSLTKKLEEEGMRIHYREEVNLIPKDIDLVILTPAIPKEHAELKWFKAKGYKILKRAEVLGLLSKSYTTIAVAGTHGKTTTSALIAHILNYCRFDVTAFLGGILVEEKVNFFLGDSKYLVVEADEYDRSFLHLYPNQLIITSLDADHLDIYGSVENMREAYFQLIRQIQEDGLLVLGPGVGRYIDLELRAYLSERRVQVFELFKDFDFDQIRIINARYTFNFSSRNVGRFDSCLPGIHNLLNLSAAIFIAEHLEISLSRISESITNFKGIKRRFEFVHSSKRYLIDDYAHHPEELKYAIDTLNRLFPDKRVAVIFQPHLFSRTKEFYRDFAVELSKVDEVVLLPIYPAREIAIEGVKSELIYNLIRSDNKYLVEENELLNKLKELEFDVLATIGAADLDKHHEPIIKKVIYN